MSLVLTRKENESVVIDGNIKGKGGQYGLTPV